MKLNYVAAVVTMMLFGSGALADGIGVSMAGSDSDFLIMLRDGILAQAEAANLSVRIDDAQNDVANQLSQIDSLIASGVSAIIVNPVNPLATQAMSDAAAAAGVPLVYVNRQPINVNSLPDNQALVASNDVENGMLQAGAMCNNWAAEGKSEVDIYVMQGDVSSTATDQRTLEIHDSVEAANCKVKVNVIDQKTANWRRDEAKSLMTNWLSTGAAFDGVIANSDEMAIGAIQAMKAAGIDLSTIQVGGVGATHDAIAAMQAGDLDITIFQNATEQGRSAVDVAIALSNGESVEQKVWVPVQTVVPSDLLDVDFCAMCGCCQIKRN